MSQELLHYLLVSDKYRSSYSLIKPRVLLHDIYYHLVLSSEKTLDRLTSLLLRHDSNATFFISGVTAEKHPDKVEKLWEQGFEVASHGYLHVSYDKIYDPKLDLKRSIRVLTMKGKAPIGFRPPYLLREGRERNFMRRFGKTIHEMACELGITYVSSLYMEKPYNAYGAMELPITFSEPWANIPQLSQSEACSYVLCHMNQGEVFGFHPFLTIQRLEVLDWILNHSELTFISLEEFLRGVTGVALSFDIAAFSRIEFIPRSFGMSTRKYGPTE